MFLTERDLENSICENQDEFIKHLKNIYGEDCDIKFLGRQIDLGNRNNIADLVYFFDDSFIDNKVRNFIIVELKFRQLQPKDLSQISRYINVLKQKLSLSEHSNYDYFCVYGVFVSLGFDDDMKNISMLDIDPIDYINVENLLKFENQGNFAFNLEYLKSLKLDNRLEDSLKCAKENEEQ